MTRVLLLALVVLAGCDSASSVRSAPSEPDAPDVKLPDTRPYFGRLKSLDAPATDAGEFMLAYCGCTCWRVMVIREDGAVRTQMLVHFDEPSARGDGENEYRVAGDAEGATLTGSVQFNAGLATGRMLVGPYAMVFEAERGNQEADQVLSCTKCHVGEDPIRVLPLDHPPYQAEPANCLTCHSLQ
jgi:hypothetical protein